MEKKRAPLWGDLLHGLSVGCYAISFFLTACVYTDTIFVTTTETMLGWEAFWMGSLMVHRGFFPPIANPLFWISIVMWWRCEWLLVAVLSLAATALSINLAVFDHDHTLVSGYYLWVTSFALILIPSLLMYLRTRRDPKVVGGRWRIPAALSILAISSILLVDSQQFGTATADADEPGVDRRSRLVCERIRDRGSRHG